jgi:hypothetical protein
MANNNPRSTTTRETEMRPQSVYAPPSTLPEPNPEPGMSFHWVATHVMGVADPSNVSKRMREGWVPVKAADHPECMVPGNKDGNIEIGGLMLCKAPTELVNSRRAYYENQAQQQMDSVDNSFLKQSDSRMPLFSEKSSSTSRSRFGSGSK